MKKYYLKDEDGYIVSKIELLEKDFFVAKVYECYEWDMNKNPINWDFHSEVIIKYDACSSWNFYGENYESEKDEINGYYHLCDSPHTFVIIMSFVWKVAKKYYLEQAEKEEDTFRKEYLIEQTEENFNPSLEYFENFLKKYKITEE